MALVGYPYPVSTIISIIKETSYFNKYSAVDNMIGSPQIPRGFSTGGSNYIYFLCGVFLNFTQYAPWVCVVLVSLYTYALFRIDSTPAPVLYFFASYNVFWIDIVLHVIPYNHRLYFIVGVFNVSPIRGVFLPLHCCYSCVWIIIFVNIIYIFTTIFCVLYTIYYLVVLHIGGSCCVYFLVY